MQYQEVTVIIEANVHTVGANVSEWVVLGGYDDADDTLPVYHESHSAVKMIGPVNAGEGENLSKALITVFERLGLKVRTLSSADD